MVVVITPREGIVQKNTWAWTLPFVAVATTATAQDIMLTTPDIGPVLRGQLESASLVFGTQDEENPGPQDYIAAARADYRALLTVMYANGFYSASVNVRVNGQEAATISPLAGPSRIDTVAITIDRGPKFTFGTATVAPLAPQTTLPDGFSAGEVAEADLVRQAALAGVAGWRDAGHAKADVADQKITANHPAARLDATVTLAPGPRLTFGTLMVTGNSDVRSSAITRIAGLPEGAVFSPEETEKAAQRLRDTGAFDSVVLREADTPEGDTLPMTIQVTETLPRRIGAGVELSSVAGLKVSAYWMHRNFWGGAERFRVDGEVAGIGGGTGGVDYTLAAALTIPAIYGPDTDFTATASISREDEPEYLLDKIETSAVVSRLIRDDLEVSGGLGILRAREETAAGVREYTLLTAPLSATLDRRDNAANAQNGYYINIEATPFISTDGDTSGARLYTDARAYRTFGEDAQFGVAARAQLGSVLGATVTEAPADFLFYSGGSGTVRGQTYNTLGLTDEAGETVSGGLSFVGAQLEARYNVTDNIAAVGFYDVGYIGATQTPGTDGDWHAGVGLGARYNTGIGPIRVDIGTPANGDDAFGKVEVYIGIGQAF